MYFKFSLLKCKDSSSILSVFHATLQVWPGSGIFCIKRLVTTDLPTFLSLFILKNLQLQIHQLYCFVFSERSLHPIQQFFHGFPCHVPRFPHRFINLSHVFYFPFFLKLLCKTKKVFSFKSSKFFEYFQKSGHCDVSG